MMPFVWWIFLWFSVGFLLTWITRKCWKIHQTVKNTRHVISLPLGTRFTMYDSDSIWVLVHLNGCGRAIEWNGNFHPATGQRHRQIVGNELNLMNLVVKVVQ